jgi:uncharacterized protein (TIGR03382 family)
VVLLPDCAHACSCGGGVPFLVLARGADASAVFSGEGLDVEEGPPRRMFGTSVSSIRVTLRVSEVWKGPRRETLEVSKPSSGASCGYPFKEGQECLLYAYGKEEPFKVDLCNETRQLSMVSVHLRVLGDGQTPGGEPLPDTSGGAAGLVAVGLAAVAAVRGRRKAVGIAPSARTTIFSTRIGRPRRCPCGRRSGRGGGPRRPR